VVDRQRLVRRRHRLDDGLDLFLYSRHDRGRLG
jgi:hypothetical protein